jgi:hypothetical protein
MSDTATEQATRAFNLELQDFLSKQMPANVAVVQRRLALDALTRIVRRSPVDTGRFRGNWQVTIGGVTDTPQPNTYDQGGEPTIAAGSAVIAGIQAYQTSHIQNALPYAIPLEDGHSKQAPSGVVGLTLLELQGALYEVPETPRQ